MIKIIRCQHCNEVIRIEYEFYKPEIYYIEGCPHCKKSNEKSNIIYKQEALKEKG